jgi:hypothetical protein
MSQMPNFNAAKRCCLFAKRLGCPLLALADIALRSEMSALEGEAHIAATHRNDAAKIRD